MLGCQGLAVSTAVGKAQALPMFTLHTILDGIIASISKHRLHRMPHVCAGQAWVETSKDPAGSGCSARVPWAVFELLASLVLKVMTPQSHHHHHYRYHYHYHHDYASQPCHQLPRSWSFSSLPPDANHCAPVRLQQWRDAHPGQLIMLQN